MAVDLEVVVPPAVERLYFWALQVSFLDGAADRGGAHLGLQWNPRHPDNGAVNWGGYRPGGGLLEGTESPLPSSPADPNTRDYPWRPGRPYRLRVAPTPGSPGVWQGEVTDLASDQTTVVRHLLAGGDRLVRPMVWSEVFARCDHPSVTARWSGFHTVTETGGLVVPRGLQVNYQSRAAGGCDNTTVAIEPGGTGLLQVTAAERAVSQGTVIPLP